VIPIRLALSNFMCYRDGVPPLSFAGIHTACIAGANGNGKSTLIDAMTWALWGKARAKSDDDLVHLGETETAVEFDFAVGAQPYRVLRKHSRPRQGARQGKTVLEFQIASDGGFRPLTGTSITQTQQKIIETLHMDYATFVNSALLLQGRADEFTVKRPVERKQVLADILGLYLYDRLEEAAKERAKEQETGKAQLESALQDIDQELSQKPDYQAVYQAGQSRLTAVEKEAAEQEARLHSLRQEKEALEHKKAELTQLEERLTRTKLDLKRWDDLAGEHCRRLEEYQALIAQRPTIEEGYARLSQTKKLGSELDQKLRLVTSLGERKHRLEMTITQAGQALVQEHAVVQSQISELTAASQKLPSLRQERGKVKAQLADLAEPEARLAAEKEAGRELRNQLNRLESLSAQLEREIRGLGEKLDLLKTPKGTRCPLCETELEADGIRLIEAKYTTERQAKLESLKAGQAELTRKKTELSRKESDTAELEARLNRDRAALQARTSVLDQGVSQAEEAAARLGEAKKNLTRIEELMAKRDFAPAEQQAFQELESELAKLSYDPEEHDALLKQLEELAQYEGLKRRLEDAEGRLSQEKEAVTRAEEAAQELRLSLEAEGEKAKTLSEELGRLPQVTSDFTQVENEHQALVSRQKQAQEALWGIKAKLERLGELEIKRREREKLLSQASKEERIYKDLAQAFGKRGIQALLIESALPEIEAEANQLLARLTDNRMHLKIETQRETKAGNVVETLDIKISDELGTRDYEMYSGGEAFRINFAIRIALSKLLARRAGAPLPTLVIDEGFGTQDSAGIEKLKEAITSIQDDFEKILVITHIEELRDAFPTRINVVKTQDGSTLEVS
jgi:exonuclease SbcC